ncbi:aminoglycoside adenylyltransferase [Acidaminobacter sp. JC074]|uniref:aminoglycoside 6-adenylyltransferase n=1 Tax=Acidaminobacter sp. JC074 TaxID=2530199 RepID=UPI001F0ED9B6|nr:aminoglycoside 6-adenylyltransferase [Acidaminobacter sp. JC074]MCH4886233.1 aminoglycoside adenylyltransferase [Acidaminobacter sp. JC074]
MRTDNDMLEMILSYAENDERVRAVTLNGSRASQTALKDKYSDFDIVYFVEDVRDFTKEKSWIEVFGDILIVQYSMDWYSHPYDYSSRELFIYLIQFADGHRIDLSLVDLSKMDEFLQKSKEPTCVLLNKDNFKELNDTFDESKFHVKEPTEFEFNNTSNEFRWMSIYITKGLCRRQIYYAKYAYDVLLMEMFMKMIRWKIGIDHDFKITLGSFNKYFNRYLSQEEMNKIHNIFPNGSYEDIWDKLFFIYDFFHELEKEVREYYSYSVDEKEVIRVRKYLQEKQEDYKQT